MATNTYTALYTNTLGTAATTVTIGSIPQGYTDLELEIVGNTTTTTTQAIYYQLNGDTTATYSATILRGNGTAASSARVSAQNQVLLNNFAALSSTQLINVNAKFMSYSNASVNKTTIIRANEAGSGTDAIVGLWRSNAPITSILLFLSGASFAIGTTINLYGIAADTGAYTAKATGGTISADQFWIYHTFTSSGTFTPSQSLSCDVLQVAGGGGAGAAYGGGGGAGGLLGFTSQALTATGYAVTVGSGGAWVGGSSFGVKGNNSQFGSLTASVGGGGGAGSTGSADAGQSGGSGGGGIGYFGGAGGAASPAGQGNAGGAGAGGNFKASGGGGGAGAVGTTGISTKAGNGGIGSAAYSTWATATSTGVGGYYAGGGGAGADSAITAGTGGTGGGGNGNTATAPTGANGTSGTANTGGGGGGASQNGTGGNGGSGIVIVRYPK